MTLTPLAQEAYELRMACMRLVRRVRYMNSSLAPHFFSVLAKLECGDSTAAELATRELVSAPSMSRTVAELDERGYLTKTPDPDDRRRVLLSITDEGRAILTTSRAERNHWMEERMAKLTDEERADLVRATALLQRMLDES